MRSNTNRAITLAGANKIFNVVDIEIKALPTGGYASSGRVSAASKTLTALCQELVKAL